jgi:hypothetical protein
MWSYKLIRATDIDIPKSTGDNTYRATLCGKVIGKRGRFLIPFPKKNGYLCISLSDGKGNPHQTLIHRFIWEYFNGKIPDSLTVDHIDEDKTNNRINNLQLLTREENSKKSNRVLSDEQIRKLVSLLETHNGRTLSKMFGVSPQLVANIRNGSCWNDITGITQGCGITYKGISSQHKGVSWDKHRSKWITAKRCGGKTRHIGRFNTEQEAAEAYKNH